MNVKGSQTEKNLMTAFSGESMARNKYTFFAEKAREESLEETAQLFEQMAKNESTHGKLLYNAVHGKIRSSLENLNEAMGGEYKEWTSMYPDFAKKAQEEGFDEIADLFKRIAAIEKDHEHQFLMALADLTIAGQKQAPEEKAIHTVTVSGFRCMFCGAAYETRADVCSLCGAIGSFESAQIQMQIAE